MLTLYRIPDIIILRTTNLIKGGESVIIILSERVTLEIDDNGGTIVVDGSRYEFFNEEDQE